MEATYQIIGGDGLTYGPVSLDQLKTWITEGRVHARTQVLRNDQNAWTLAGALPETGLTKAPTIPFAASSCSSPTDAALVLDKRVRAGASWFFWIAGLSLINSVVLLSGNDWSFIIGLGVTQVIDVIARELGAVGKIIGFALDLAVAGGFVFFGWQAGRRQTWAFVVGMVLYLLDGLLFLLAFDLLSLGFHAFALYCIFVGLQANRQLQGAQTQPAAA